MADLKAGTTIGGTLVWTQGNFPLYPTGNTLLYKTFKVYSENDKPQAADNDFVSKANGGTYAKTVAFNSNIVINQGGATYGSLNSINLYGSDPGGNIPTYGIFVGNSTDAKLGKHGALTSNWAVYNVATNGGWIFRTKATNVASISNSGVATFNTVNIDDSPTLATHATRKDYVDGLINTTTNLANTKVSKSGDTMTGTLTVPNIISSNLATTNTQVPQLGQVVQRGIILDYGTF